jgi:hypothetical protein
VNNHNWQEREPTDEQLQMAGKVEEAVVNEIRLLGNEGIPVAILLTGLFSSIVRIISHQSGPDQVAPWFELQATFARELLGQPPKLN